MNKLKNSDLILDLIHVGQYRMTLHAQQRMSERFVSHMDIKNCALTGSVKVYPDGKYRIKGWDVDEGELTVVCVFQNNEVLIITVF